MKIENLFEQISSLDSFDEKSGVLADAVISSLDAPINNAALMCGLIYWFNEGVIRSFINDDFLVKEAINTILHLPFVEAKGNGFTFHESVRNGLRSSYEKEPDLILKAYSTALPELLNNMEDDMAAITATFGLIATNDSRADDTISSIIERFTNSHQLNKLKIFTQDMQEVLWLAQDNTLSDKRWVQIGWVQFLSNKLNDVISSCERAIRVNHSSEDAYLLRATVSKIKGDFDIALDELNDTVSRFPNSTKAYLSRADLHLLREDYGHASLDYYKVLEIDPKSGFAYIGLAKIFRQKGNKAKQLSLYKQAIDLDPENIWIYMERGSVLSGDGQYEEALRDFNKVLEINPAVDLALIGRATVYENQEEYDIALTDLENVLAINSENVLAIYKMASIYYRQHKYHDALIRLQEVLSLNPAFIQAYESLWKTHVKLGEIHQAREYFLKALALPSQEPKYYTGLILVASKQKQFELGILAAQKGLETNSDTAKFLLVLGIFYIQTGELELAESNLNKVLSLKEGKSMEETVTVNLGIIRWLKGDKPAAQELFQRTAHLITEKQKRSNYYDNSGKNSSKKRALQEQSTNDLYILGWINMVLGQTETGMSQIKKSVENALYKEGKLLDLRDWTSVISKLPDAPMGLQEIQSWLDEELLE